MLGLVNISKASIEEILQVSIQLLYWQLTVKEYLNPRSNGNKRSESDFYLESLGLSDELYRPLLRLNSLFYKRNIKFKRILTLEFHLFTFE